MSIPIYQTDKRQKAYRIGFCILSLMLLSMAVQSQDLKLTGTLVAEEDKSALPGATIQLLDVADSAHLFTTTNEVGLFGFSGLRKGAYTLSISYVGYHPVTQNISLASDQELNTIRLSPKDELLKEVEIVEKLPRAIQKGDTTEFNAKAYQTQPDASAEDLLRKMPGIIMVNGSVQAQGEDVKQVLVDGKPFFGNDPSAALKNLPAEVIDKIQVFDRQSDQSQFTGFDDGQSAKTINIITRPDKRNGQFGKLYSGYGLDKRYGLGGNVHVFNRNQRFSIIGQSNNINVQNFATEDILGVVGGSGQGKRRGGRGSGGDANHFMVGQQNGLSRTHSFGINYTNSWHEKVDVSGSYFFNNSSNRATQNLSRETFLSADSSQYYDESSVSLSQNFNHRFNMRMVYTLDERNSIIFQPALSVQQNLGNEQNDATNSLAGDRWLSATLNQRSTDLYGFHFSNNVLYKHRFEKKGRTLSLRIITQSNHQKGENSLLASNTFYANEETRLDSLNQSGTLDHEMNTYATNIMYTEPLGEKWNMQLNYEASLRKGESDKRIYHFEEASQSYTLLDSTLSNQFISPYFTQEAGTALRFKQGNLSLTSKVDYQLAKLSNQQSFPSEFTLSRTFQNILPSAILHYRMEGGSNFRMAYRTSTTAPDVKDLQNVLDNSNPLMLRQGNPALRQQYQHHLSGRFAATNADKATSFFVMLSGSYTDDYVGRSTLIARQDTLLSNNIILQQGAQLSSPVNFEHSWNTRTFMSYGLPLSSIKSNLNLNSSVNFNRTPGLINDQLNFADQLGFGLGMVLSSSTSEVLDFTLASRSNYQLVENRLRKELNNNYFNQHTELKMHVRSELGLFVETELNHQYYSGLSSGFDQSYWLLNIGVGTKVFKNQLGEIKLTTFDLFNQNNSIGRNIGETYVEDVQNRVLNRFAMLTFSYQVRNFRM